MQFRPRLGERVHEVPVGIFRKTLQRHGGRGGNASCAWRHHTAPRALERTGEPRRLPAGTPVAGPHSGVTLNPSLLEHKCTSIVDFPQIEVLFPAPPDPLGPYDAKALGEPPVVPVLAVIANAVANATGVWLYEAPFTPKRVLQAIQEQGKG